MLMITKLLSMLPSLKYYMVTSSGFTFVAIQFMKYYLVFLCDVTRLGPRSGAVRKISMMNVSLYAHSKFVRHLLYQRAKHQCRSWILVEDLTSHYATMTIRSLD